METNDNNATNTTHNSADVAAPTAQEADTGAEQPSTEMSIEDYQQALEKANREAARYRVERNELRDDAQKYRDIQEAEKTELQRAQEALEAERTKTRQYEVELARANALAKYGIAEENADLLGSDPEKFDDNAQRLSQLQQQAVKRSAPPSDYPVESLTPGASTPEGKPDQSYPASWAVTGPFAKNK